MSTTELCNDCEILLDRAFKNKLVSCFGIDGNGELGSHPFAKYFKIEDVTCYFRYHTTGTGQIDGVCTAVLSLEGYNSADCGHAATDQNLKISLNKLLVDQVISPTSWKWASEQHQGPNEVVLHFSMIELLG